MKKNACRSVICVLLSLVMLFSINIVSFAEGTGNVNGGGGTANNTKQKWSYWRQDNTGYRVSVLDKRNGNLIGHTVDYHLPKFKTYVGYEDGITPILHNDSYSNKIQLIGQGVVLNGTERYVYQNTDFQWRKQGGVKKSL